MRNSLRRWRLRTSAHARGFNLCPVRSCRMPCTFGSEARACSHVASCLRSKVHCLCADSRCQPRKTHSAKPAYIWTEVAVVKPQHGSQTHLLFWPKLPFQAWCPMLPQSLLYVIHHVVFSLSLFFKDCRCRGSRIQPGL